MAKRINKLRLFWLGKSLFSQEYLRLVRAKGSKVTNRYLRMILKTIENERLVEHENKAIVNFFIPPIPSRSFARYLKSYVNSLFIRKNKINMGVALIATTMRCPYKCWYCSAYGMPEGEITMANLEKIIEILKGWGTSIIGFTGGEPLLRIDTDAIIRRYADDFTFIIFSSGYGLDLARAKNLKKSGLFHIAISLDDHEPSLHNKARGAKGAFQTSVEAIRNAKKAGIYTIIQSVVTGALLNNGRIWKFLNFINELGADELLLLEPLGTGRLFDSENEVFLDHPEQEKLKWFHDIAVDCLSVPKITSFADFEYRDRYGCGAGFQHAYIDNTGNLWPCNFLPISLGNMLVEPDVIHKRLEKYFGLPCDYCILMKKRDSLRKLSRDGFPIPFSLARNLLERRAKMLTENNLPTFYKSLQEDDHG